MKNIYINILRIEYIYQFQNFILKEKNFYSKKMIKYEYIKNLILIFLIYKIDSEGIENHLINRRLY